jgi:hypothetical protein
MEPDVHECSAPCVLTSAVDAGLCNTRREWALRNLLPRVLRKAVNLRIPLLILFKCRSYSDGGFIRGARLLSEARLVRLRRRMAASDLRLNAGGSLSARVCSLIHNAASSNMRNSPVAAILQWLGQALLFP